MPRRRWPVLATLDDVKARYPVPADQDDRVTTLLTDASAVVTSYTRNDFTLTDTIARIRPIGGRIILPQRPVVSVNSIKVIDYNENLITLAGWMWDGGQEVWL